MTISQRTLVVVPCYNEAERIRLSEFDAALESNPKLGFVMVDDGSRDSTLALMQRFRSSHEGRVHVLALEQNAGKGEAVRRGVLLAFEQGAELIGYWDADLATPLRDIEEFARALEMPHVSLVVGSRIRLMGRNIRRDPVRHYLGRLFATAVSVALSLPIYDTQCGAKLFRATPRFHAIFSTPFSGNWTFDVEIFERLASDADGARHLEGCLEFPLQEWTDAPGSKLRPSHFAEVGVELVQLFWRNRPGARSALTK